MRFLPETMRYVMVIAIVLSASAVLIFTRAEPPWRKRISKPAKLWKLSRDQIRAFRERETCPEAFDPANPLYQPINPPRQHLDPADIEAIVTAITEAMNRSNERKSP